MSNEILLAEATQLGGELRDIRRDLHRHPELSFQEVRTTAVIKEQLSRLPGVEILPWPTPTGVVAQLRGNSAEVIALRADIDALPIKEKNHHSYVSEQPGKMHACGHDGHVAILLGAIKLLAQRPHRHCTWRFIFQPAEEVAPGGAQDFLAHGVLNQVREIYGFHLNATSDFGKVGYYDGAVMAGGVRFSLELIGKSGHASYPEKCINPIYGLAEVVRNLEQLHQDLTARFKCNLVPFKIEANSHGEIPERASLMGQFKYLEPQADKEFRKVLTDAVEACLAQYGVTGSIKYQETYPISWNNADLGRKIVRPAAEKLGLPLTPIPPSMGSDDFAWYAQKIPAYYMTFGIRRGMDFPIAHTGNFDFDEAILPLGAAQMAACVLESDEQKLFAASCG